MCHCVFFLAFSLHVYSGVIGTSLPVKHHPLRNEQEMAEIHQSRDGPNSFSPTVLKLFVDPLWST